MSSEALNQSPAPNQLPALINQLRELIQSAWGFDKRNLRHMRNFYQCFAIWNTVRSELSWTHYWALLRVESEAARQWHMNEAAEQNWSTKYKLVLPTEEELRAELEQEQWQIAQNESRGRDVL